MSQLAKVMRSSAAAYRRAQRSQQRQRTSDVTREYKQQQKEQAISDAYAAVRYYNNYIDLIKSVHKETTDPVNWEELQSAVSPAKPEKQSLYKDAAVFRLVHYKPSLIDKLLRLEKKRRRKLERQIASAGIRDEQLHTEAMKQYEEEKAEFDRTTSIARGVLNRDIEAYEDAINFFDPFSDIKELGTQLYLTYRQDAVTINIFLNGADIIPDYILSQTSTGKLSRKNMPAGRFNELYQDYVCSCILRTAREIFAHLPVSQVLISTQTSLFDSTTGHEQEETIVSAVITPGQLARLNFDTLDPSDSMKNFLHNMQFAKTKGFSPVEKLNTDSLIL
jgi:hypothetical protein